jgi:hypothetical protein
MEAAAAVARAVAERMGGPAESDESLAGRWAEASYTMKSQRGKLTIPIGLLSHVGRGLLSSISQLNLSRLRSLNV